MFGVVDTHLHDVVRCVISCSGVYLHVRAAKINWQASLLLLVVSCA